MLSEISQRKINTESNEQTELMREIGEVFRTHKEQDDSQWGLPLGCEGIEQKKKKYSQTCTIVLIAGRRGHKGTKR